jgi:hypothetical protein
MLMMGVAVVRPEQFPAAPALATALWRAHGTPLRKKIDQGLDQKPAPEEDQKNEEGRTAFSANGRRTVRTRKRNFKSAVYFQFHFAADTGTQHPPPRLKKMSRRTLITVFFRPSATIQPAIKSSGREQPRVFIGCSSSGQALVTRESERNSRCGDWLSHNSQPNPGKYVCSGRAR